MSPIPEQEKAKLIDDLGTFNSTRAANQDIVFSVRAHISTCLEQEDVQKIIDAHPLFLS